MQNYQNLKFQIMFMLFISVVFTTALGITAFLLMSSGDMLNFKHKFFFKPIFPKLPVVTAGGKVVDSKEDLEAHLEVLENRLKEKVSEIETSKSKVDDAKHSIEKLNITQVQVKKYYNKLKEEIKKTEDDCEDLQLQIDDFRIKRTELEDEMRKNQIYYKTLLDAVKSGTSIAVSMHSSKTSVTSEVSISSTSLQGSGSKNSVSDGINRQFVRRKHFEDAKVQETIT